MKESIISFLFHYVVRFGYKILWWPIPCGLDNIKELPADGAILAGNHFSHYDPITVGIYPARFPHFMAKRELFTGKFGWFFKIIDLIPVDRSKHDSGLDGAKEHLEKGHLVVLFPEGTTKWKQPNQLLPFKLGAVRLAASTGRPIIPFAVVGKPKLFHYGCAKVVFGQPIWISSKRELLDENERVRKAVAELMKELGCNNVQLIPGAPAHNPSKEPPLGLAKINKTSPL